MTEPDLASSLCFVDTDIWLYAFIDGPDVVKSESAPTAERRRTLARGQQPGYQSENWSKNAADG